MEETIIEIILTDNYLYLVSKRAKMEGTLLSGFVVIIYFYDCPIWNAWNCCGLGQKVIPRNHLRKLLNAT